MAESGARQGKRTCPVCDETVSAQVTICPSCNTDLSLFVAEEMNMAPEDAETLKTQIMAEDNVHLSNLLKVVGGEIMPAEAMEDAFECPDCNRVVPADAKTCPYCNVEFEIEEVFECPMCSTMIDVTVDKCPSCGAEFEEESTESEPIDMSSQIIEEAEPEKQAEPVSFADRLRHVKDDPTTAPVPEPVKPPKELSFAERMKAMKDGTLGGSKPEPAPTKPEVPLPAEQTTDTGPEARIKKPTTYTETAKKSSFKELPVYISEVKKLLMLANELKIDISSSKALINQAVTAGKKRDLENAIKQVKEGKAGLERDLRSSMINKLRTLQNAVRLEKKAGKDISAMESDIEEIKKSMDAGDFYTASDSIKRIESQVASSVSSALPQAELEVIGKTLEDAVALRINIDEAKFLYDEAKMAVDQENNEKASELAKKAGESLTRILPGYIASEMRKAKVTLRELKMMNVDISQPVNILKETNNYVKDGDYCEALSSIKEFKDSVSQSEQ